MNPIRSGCFERCSARPPSDDECPVFLAIPFQTILQPQISLCSRQVDSENRASCPLDPPRGIHRRFGSQCPARFGAQIGCGLTTRDIAKVPMTTRRIVKHRVVAARAKPCSENTCGLCKGVGRGPDDPSPKEGPERQCQCPPFFEGSPSGRSWAHCSPAAHHSGRDTIPASVEGFLVLPSIALLGCGTRSL